MIRARKGMVDIKGDESEVIAEFMCLMYGMAITVIIPLFGKENLKTELYKIVDETCKDVLESEE